MTGNNRIKIHYWMSLLVRIVLGVVFILAGIPKIMNSAAFANAVYNYQLLPDALINFFAVFLPWLEVITGFLLISGFWLPGAVTICNGLMITFMAALIISAFRGLNISCGCFSTDLKETIDGWTIARDACMLLTSLYLLFVVFARGITSRKDLAKMAL